MATPEDQIHVPEAWRFSHTACDAYRAGYLAAEHAAATGLDPAAPAEIWALRRDGGEGLVPPIDAPDVDVFMATASREDAEYLAAHQQRLYSFDSAPARIK